MKSGIKSHKIILLLSIATIIIWTIVLLRFTLVIKNDLATMPILGESDSDSLDLDIHSGIQDSLLKQMDIVQDPFQIPILLKKRKKIKSPSPGQKTIVPDLKYIGYLNDSNGILALLQYADGSTIIGREGETYDHIYFRKINKDSIEFVKEGIFFRVGIRQYNGD
jgi:hypothetical protein